MNPHDVEAGAIYHDYPRLEKLPVDLSEYRKEREEGWAVGLLPISPEMWRSHVGPMAST